MRVLTLVPSRLRSALEKASEPGTSVVHAANTFIFMRALRSEPWSILALDPTTFGDAELEMVVASAQDAMQGILLCAPFTMTSVRCATIAAQRAIVDVLFTGEGDEQQLLRLKLRALRPRSAVGLVLHGAASRVHALPYWLAPGIVRLFCALPLPQSVSAIIPSPRRTRKTIDRHMHAAGFRSTRRLLEVIRIAWAWDLLRVPVSYSITDVVRQCGYASGHELWAHAHGLLAIAPSVLARTTPSAALVDRLLTNVVAGKRI